MTLYWQYLSMVQYGCTVLVLLLCVFVVVRAIAAPSSLRRVSSCGGCGYTLTELGSGRCPECGAWILRAGVLTPALAVRHRGSLAAAIVGWTVITLTVAMHAHSFFIAAFTPLGGPGSTVRLTKSHGFVTYEQLRHSGAEPELYAFTIRLNVVVPPQGGAESGTVEVDLLRNGVAQVTVSIDAATGAYTLKRTDGATVRSGKPFDAVAAGDMFSAAGVVSDSETRLAELKQVLQLIRDAKSDPLSFERLVPAGAGRLVTPFGGGGRSIFVRATSGTSSTRPVLGRAERLVLNWWGGVVVAYALGVVLILAARRRFIRVMFSPHPPSLDGQPSDTATHPGRSASPS